MKRGTRNNSTKIDQKIKELVDEVESEKTIEPKNPLDIVKGHKEFLELMRKLEENDLQLIQAVQGLDEDIAYLNKGIDTINMKGAEKLGAIKDNIE